MQRTEFWKRALGAMLVVSIVMSGLVSSARAEAPSNHAINDAAAGLPGGLGRPDSEDGALSVFLPRRVIQLSPSLQQELGAKISGDSHHPAAVCAAYGFNNHFGIYPLELSAQRVADIRSGIPREKVYAAACEDPIALKKVLLLKTKVEFSDLFQKPANTDLIYEGDGQTPPLRAGRYLSTSFDHHQIDYLCDGRYFRCTLSYSKNSGWKLERTATAKPAK